MKRNLFLALNAVVAAVLLVLLLRSFDFTALSMRLATANLSLLLFALAFYLIAHVLAGLRYKFLLPGFSFKTLFSAHMKAMLASDATPGRLGYSYFVFDMRKQGLSAGKAAKMLGIALGSDFLVRGLLAVLAVFIFSQEFGGLGLLVLLASLALMALLFHRLDFFSSFLSRLPLYGKRLSGAYNAVFKQNTSMLQLALAFAISIAGALARGFEWLFVLNAIGLNAGIIELTVLSALLTALSFIPLSLSGFGFQEGGGIVLFTRLLGFDLLQAAGAVLLIRFVDTLGDFIVGGWFFASAVKPALTSAKAAKEARKTAKHTERRNQ